MPAFTRSLTHDDRSEWPRVLENILQKLHNVCISDFLYGILADLIRDRT
jgi:hypothetical protein